MAELLPDLPAEFEIEGTMPGADYIATLQLMVQMLKLMHGGYNSQLQAETDAAATYQQCLQALQDTLEAASSHLPLQDNQYKKILMSSGVGGGAAQAYWGGDWQVKTADFNLQQLDTFIAHATATPINITLVTPEIVGMHVIVRNSLLSTQVVKVVLNTETVVGVNESWAAGDEIELMPGDVFQAICMDITPGNEVWELI